MQVSQGKVPSLHRTLLAVWRTLTKDFADPYRPELHYMRGPGPKWKAKHAEPTDLDLAPMTEAA